jgi:hypothetical protein
MAYPWLCLGVAFWIVLFCYLVAVFFTFFLDKKSNKQINPPRRIQSRNSPEDLNTAQCLPAQTAPSERVHPGGLDCLTARAENF